MGSTTQAFSFLVETLFQLYIAALMLRVLLEALRADYYNPVCQALIRITDPLVKPLARVVPNIGSVSTAGIIWLYVLELIMLFVLAAIANWALDWSVLLVLGVLRLVRMLLVLYMVLIIVAVILSWVGQGFRHPIVPLVFQLTDPVLAPIRRILPALGGFDLSPLVALIGIQFLLILLGV